MKKLTLDQTWTECLKMWKWIAGQIKKNNDFSEDIEDIYELKSAYANKRDMNVFNDCFFCEFAMYQYANSNDVEYGDVPEICDFCLGKNVEREDYPNIDENNNVWCTRIGLSYEDNPLAFYAELKRLNKIRLSRKTNR